MTASEADEKLHPGCFEEEGGTAARHTQITIGFYGGREVT